MALAISWLIFLVALFKARPWTRMDGSETRPSEGKWGTLFIVGGLVILCIPYAPAGIHSTDLDFEIAIGLSFLSLLLCFSAILATRKQIWFPEGAFWPQLPRTGIYGIVRHPVYTALIVQAFATAFAVSWWLWMFAGIFFLVLGIDLRAAADDLILANLFQDEFFEYQAGSKAYLPWVH